MEVGREAAVHAEDLLINQSAQGHSGEGLVELLPELQVVALLALLAI